MCGRFVRYSSIPDMVNEFGVEEPAFDPVPSYNIAPSQEVLAIKRVGKKRLVLCRWGFLPSWSKDPAAGYKMINARAETLSEKRSFKSAFLSNRILIAADGFYEWKKEGKEKIPFYIRLASGNPFGFAGLLSEWSSPEGKKICTCTIITTRANTLLAPIHDRMPVIIHKEDVDLWLDPAKSGKKVLQDLLQPYDSGAMEYYEVSRSVNSPRSNSPSCIKPLKR